MRGGDGTDVRRMWIRWVVGSRTGVMNKRYRWERYGTGARMVWNTCEEDKEQVREGHGTVDSRETEHAKKGYVTGERTI